MARNAQAAELALRAKNAGFKVTQPRSLSGAYKVHMPPCRNDSCNHQMQIHLTSSDVNFHHTVLREMEAHGLSELEAKAATDKEKERLARIERDRAAAERKAATLAKQNTLTNKAAGPYMREPEDVGYEWFAQEHPAMWTRVVWITPDLAAKILENHNLDNRPLNATRVEHYRNIILTDQWKITHQGLAQDTRGILQDGQHRLNAIVAAGEVAPDIRCGFQWSVGMPIENFKAIDENLLRTAAQLFGKGGEKNGSTLQAMVRLVLAYKAPDGNVRRQYRIQKTNAEVLEAFEKDADLYRACTAKAQSNYRKVKCSPTVLATAMYLIRSLNGADNRYVDLFFEGLIANRKPGTKYVLEDDDPRAVLRETLERIASHPKNKRPPIDVVALFILSWNNIVLNRGPRSLNFAEDAQPPTVLISKPDEGATPRALIGEFLPGEEVEDTSLAA